MEPINTFAQAPQTSEGYYNRNNAIAPEIIKYLEDHSDLRQFFTPKPMKGSKFNCIFLKQTYFIFIFFFILFKHVLILFWKVLLGKYKSITKIRGFS